MGIGLKFHGGADEVTGSRHLLRAGNHEILLDCGLFQGHRREAIEKNSTFPANPKTLQAVLLSHAHIDHSGGLPLLAKMGFSGAIHCTQPTADLCRIMLLDSAFLQEEDAKFFNKIHQTDGELIEPLYTKEDAEAATQLFKPHPYGEFFPVAAGIRARFLNAGHVLGSAMIEVEIDTPQAKRRVHFTGDLGRQASLLMSPPVPPSNADILMIESTYGSRNHPPVPQAEKMLEDIIHQATREKGVILIPSFALERTQEVVYLLEKLRRENRIPPIHLYVDSPMAVDITGVYVKHLKSEGLSPQFRQYVETKGDPFGLDTVRYIRSVDESKALNEKPGQKIIVAGSGMCEGGRILHHLRNYIDKDNTLILLVGYQVSGTLGRRLFEGARKVKIFGLQHEVRAKVQMMPHLSSHADQSDILWFVKKLNPRPRRIFLVHGDTEERAGLAAALKAAGVNNVETPLFGQEFSL